MQLPKPLLPLVVIHVALLLFSAGMLFAQDLEEGVKDVARQLSVSMTGQVKRIAVVEFPELNGYQSALGQFVAEELITQLSAGAQPQFDVVERRQLARVLKEQDVTDGSLFDTGSISKIGKVLGIEAIITGSIADLGTDIKVNARAVSVATAKVFAAASTKITKSDTVQQLMRQSAGSAQSAGSVQAPLKRPIQREHVFFQNEFLRVEVSAVAVSKTKNRVSFSLTFQNASTQDVLIGMDRGYHYCRARVTDNLGTVVPTKNYGQEVFVTGLPCLYGDGAKEKEQEYARLSAGSKTSVVIAFENEDELFEGGTFAISAELLKFDGGEWSMFSMGISDIELPK